MLAFHGRLYIKTVLLFVYRLRLSGQRVDRLTLRAHGGLRGEFVYEAGPHQYWGKVPMYAKLLAPGTTNQLLPHLEDARIARVRRGLLVTGNEVIAFASKSKGQRYRQTWVCTLDRIAPEDWPAPPRNPVARGFDPADDDLE